MVAALLKMKKEKRKMTKLEKSAIAMVEALAEMCAALEKRADGADKEAREYAALCATQREQGERTAKDYARILGEKHNEIAELKKQIESQRSRGRSERRS